MKRGGQRDPHRKLQRRHRAGPPGELRPGAEMHCGLHLSEAGIQLSSATSYSRMKPTAQPLPLSIRLLHQPCPHLLSTQDPPDLPPSWFILTSWSGGVPQFFSFHALLSFLSASPHSLRIPESPRRPKANMYAISNKSGQFPVTAHQEDPQAGASPRVRWGEEGREKLAWPCVEFGGPRAAGLCLTFEMRPGEQQGL